MTTTTPRYSAKDPRFQLWCTPCRFGFHDGCIHELEIPEPNVFAGSYRCSCGTCRSAK